MQYQIKDAEGRFRYLTDRMPIESKEQAEFYITISTRDFHTVAPQWFPFELVEVE